MKGKLFLLDGTSGVWKSDLIHYVQDEILRSIVVGKISTRTQRPNEGPDDSDLTHVTREQFQSDRPDFCYRFGGNDYGIRKNAIADALSRYENVFVIVRNTDIITEISSVFSGNYPVSVFVYMDSEVVEKRAAELADPEVQKSVEKARTDYLRKPEVYDEIVINGSNPADFRRLLDLQIRRHTTRSSRISITRGDERTYIIGTRKMQVLYVTILGFVSAAGLGFAINILTSDEINYWKTVALVSVSVLTLVSVALNILLLNRWMVNDSLL